MAAPQPVDKLEIQFVADRETKGTIVYVEHGPIGSETRIGTLYLRKGAHKEMGHPERLLVTLVADDESRMPRGGPKG